MRIDVTQDAIDRGHRCKSQFCPVALAIYHQTGERVKVTAHAIENRHGARLDSPPSEVTRFVLAFDRGEPATPFGFELPDDFLAAGA